MDYVAAHAARRLCMRLLVPVFRTVQFGLAKGIAWQPLVDAQLQELVQSPNVPMPLKGRDQDEKLIGEAVRLFPGSVQDQFATSWKSRAAVEPRSSGVRRNLIEAGDIKLIAAALGGDGEPILL